MSLFQPNKPMEAPAVPEKDLEARVIEALRTCYDPEIPVDIYELGLVYGIYVDPASKVIITMTLTAPNCPVAESLPEEVKAAVKKVPGVSDVKVQIVFEPPWDFDKMSPAAKLKLGMY